MSPLAISGHFTARLAGERLASHGHAGGYDTVTPMGAPPSSLRLDKWLWAARFFKTRSLAAAACAGGKIDVNDDAAKPARLVRPGDIVNVTLPRGRRRVAKVLLLDDRRGSGEAARRLYDDLTPPEPPRLRQAPPPYRPPGAGRPTKRERRETDRLRGW